MDAGAANSARRPTLAGVVFCICPWEPRGQPPVLTALQGVPTGPSSQKALHTPWSMSSSMCPGAGVRHP